MTEDAYNSIIFQPVARKQLFEMYPKVLLTDVLVKFGLNKDSTAESQAAHLGSIQERSREKKLYACHLCNVDGLNRKSISQHIYSAHGSSCNVCGKHYSQSKAFKLIYHWKQEHADKHHEASRAASSVQQNSTDKSGSSISVKQESSKNHLVTCVECAASFESLSELTKHMSDIHKGRKRKDTDSDITATKRQKLEHSNPESPALESVSMVSLSLPKDWDDAEIIDLDEVTSDNEISDNMDPLVNLKFLINAVKPTPSDNETGKETTAVIAHGSPEKPQTDTSVVKNNSSHEQLWEELKEKAQCGSTSRSQPLLNPRNVQVMPWAIKETATEANVQSVAQLKETAIPALEKLTKSLTQASVPAQEKSVKQPSTPVTNKSCKEQDQPPVTSSVKSTKQLPPNQSPEMTKSAEQPKANTNSVSSVTPTKQKQQAPVPKLVISRQKTYPHLHAVLTKSVEQPKAMKSAPPTIRTKETDKQLSENPAHSKSQSISSSSKSSMSNTIAKPCTKSVQQFSTSKSLPLLESVTSGYFSSTDKFQIQHRSCSPIITPAGSIDTYQLQQQLCPHIDAPSGERNGIQDLSAIPTSTHQPQSASQSRARHSSDPHAYPSAMLKPPASIGKHPHSLYTTYPVAVATAATQHYSKNSQPASAVTSGQPLRTRNNLVQPPDYNSFHMNSSTQQNASGQTPVTAQMGGLSNSPDSAPQTNQPYHRLLKRLKPDIWRCKACNVNLTRDEIRPHLLTTHKDYLHSRLYYAKLKKQNQQPTVFSQPKLTCSFCGVYTTVDSGELATHIVAMHKKDFLRKCDFCDYESLFSSHVQQHMDTHHKWRFCDMCHFSTRNHVQLIDHVSVVHLGLVD